MQKVGPCFTWCLTVLVLNSAKHCLDFFRSDRRSLSTMIRTKGSLVEQYSLGGRFFASYSIKRWNYWCIFGRPARIEIFMEKILSFKQITHRTTIQFQTSWERVLNMTQSTKKTSSELEHWSKYKGSLCKIHINDLILK